MNTPTSLGLIGLLALAGLAMLLPGIRFWRRWNRARHLSSRVLAEDALKHVQESEYRGRLATLQSLAGTLGIGVGEAGNLAAALESRGLLRTQGESFAVTISGREYALQVIRAHRLWERHQADETGVSAAAWHSSAERREHRLTPAQADALAARLGHPRFDPHGDPIPTARGDIPDLGAAIPLSEVSSDRWARIVHIEDEPAESFARIVAAGLHVGSDVHVLDGGAGGIRFRVEGEERVLSPVLAAGVTVVELTQHDEEEEVAEKLSQLGLGERAKVVAISRACRGLERRRLLDLGVLPGTEIEAVLRSPSGDPTAYLLRGTTIAIRKNQADRIRIRRVAGGGTS